MQITPPRSGAIGAEITDVDLTALGGGDAERIRQAVYAYKLVVFKDQHLSEEQYITAARNLGRPQVYFQDNYHHPDHPEIFVSSNVPMHGTKVGVAGTGQFWHTDYSFFDEPLSMTMVYPQVVPDGDRETYYIDMERAYRELPDRLREHMRPHAYHDAFNFYKIQPKDIDRPIVELIDEFHEIAPGAWHPMVIRHPVTDAEILYVSHGFTTKLEGMTHEQYSRALAEIFEFVGSPERVHRHPWRLGEILMWDNRSLIHQASPVPPGEQSCSYRIGVYDELPFYVNGNGTGS